MSRGAGWTGIAAVVVSAGVLGGCGGGGGTEAAPAPAEVAIGRRLFRETRFAQYFATHFGGNVNVTPPPADPVLATTMTTRGSLPGAITGPTMSCRGCHLHTEGAGFANGGLRTFSDYARRSPLPVREDGQTTTVRNARSLVGALKGDFPLLLHYDGEFTNATELIRATILGRNFGWLLTEWSTATAHVARVIREDDGSGPGAQATEGWAYAALLRADPGVPASLVLPPAFRIDPRAASDEAVVDAVAVLIQAFLGSIDFGRDAAGELSRAPYDAFLVRNDLPRAPDPGESGLAYSRRLRTSVAALTNPEFVPEDQATIPGQPVGYAFGPVHLEGLRIFLAEPISSPPSPAEIAQGGIGNCIACHSGPGFTDGRAHNVGITQVEYDGVFGEGAFLALPIPGLAARAASPELYLPPSPAHPSAQGIFRRIADPGSPLSADLGLWNVFANPDLPAPQAGLTAMVEAVSGLVPGSMTPDDLLPLTIGMFKTPGLRSPALAAPYFHDGSIDFLEDVSDHYRTFAEQARAGLARNADPETLDVALVEADLSPLAAFMRSLNEDFQ
jgi:hypothetical protein